MVDVVVIRTFGRDEACICDNVKLVRRKYSTFGGFVSCED